MDDNLFKLIKTFVGVFSMVIIGQIIRRIVMKTPEDMRMMRLLTRLYVWCTIPATIFIAVYSLKSWPREGWYLAASCAAYSVLMLCISMFVFSFMSDPKMRASCCFSTVCFSTGLYLAMINMLSGTHAVAMLMLFDIPNNIVLFLAAPFLLTWAKQPHWGESMRRLRGKVGPAIYFADESGKTPPSMSPIPLNTSFSSTADNSVSLEHSASSTDGESAKDNELTHRRLSVDVVIVEPSSSPATEDEPIVYVGLTKEDLEKKGFPLLAKVLAWLEKPAVSRIVLNMPIWALVLGLICGLGGANIPSIVIEVITIPKNANAFVAYTLLGLMLDVKKELIKKIWPQVVIILVLRLVFGVAAGVILRVLIGQYFSEYGKMILLFAFSMSLASPMQVLAQEAGTNVQVLALVSTLSGLISFIVIAVMFAIDGTPVAS